MLNKNMIGGLWPEVLRLEQNPHEYYVGPFTKSLWDLKARHD